MTYIEPLELISQADDFVAIFGEGKVHSAVDYLLLRADRQAKADLANAAIQPAQRLYNLMTRRAAQLAHYETPAGKREKWAKQTIEEGW